MKGISAPSGTRLRLKGTQMLKGYKTYITAIVAVVGALGAYLTGEMQLADAAQIIVTALIGAFVRNGMA